MGVFAQSNLYYDTNSINTVNTTDTGALAGLGGLLIIYLIVWVVSVIALWKVFEKAGEKGWKSLIPIYNFWVLCEIAGKPGWWSLSFIFALIPVINIIGWVVPLVVWIIVALEIGKAFKKSTAFSVVALIIFSFIGLLILGFGQDKYHKPATHKSHTSGPAPKPA